MLNFKVVIHKTKHSFCFCCYVYSSTIYLLNYLHSYYYRCVGAYALFVVESPIKWHAHVLMWKSQEITCVYIIQQARVGTLDFVMIL